MRVTVKLFIPAAICFMVAISGSHAQGVNMEGANPEYIKVLNKRTDKILKEIDIDEKKKYKRVKNAIVEQYYSLSAIHDSLAARTETLEDLELDEETEEARKQALKDQADAALYRRHAAYLARLSEDLTPEQVDQVKDGMTYGVMPITYKGFEDMLLDLTDEQKRQIRIWLYEARERAMDQGSSEGKHRMFGEYKGRINNYLSDQGYDLKKESKAWHERMRAEGKDF